MSATLATYDPDFYVVGERTPEPGLYRGVPESVYHGEWDAVSRGMLVTLLDRSAAHLRYEMDHPRRSTPAMRLGIAIHHAVLEPDLFSARYVMAPQMNRATKEGKARERAFLLEECAPRLLAAGGESIEEWDLGDMGALRRARELVEPFVLSHEDYARCVAIATSARKHELVRLLMEASGENEISGLWLDAPTERACRLRTDRYIADSARGPVVLDVKSTTDASPHGFARQVAQAHYHMQAAWYTMGMRAITGEPHEEFWWLAYEKEPPFATGVWGIDDVSMRLGRRQCRDMLDLFCSREEANEWPDYAELGARRISLPHWYRQQHNG